MTAEIKIEFDLDIRKAIPGYEAWHDMAKILLPNSLTASAKFYLSRLDEASKIKAEPRFLPSIENSIHFITEAKTIELLKLAGFNQVTKFYNAFLFGGWIAQYTGS